MPAASFWETTRSYRRCLKSSSIAFPLAVFFFLLFFVSFFSNPFKIPLFSCSPSPSACYYSPFFFNYLPLRVFDSLFDYQVCIQLTDPNPWLAQDLIRKT